MSKLRPGLPNSKGDRPCPTGGTAYLMIYSAVERKRGLVHGLLHDHGESCAIGSYWDYNPKTALPSDLIDEVAMVNDSVPHMTEHGRRNHVLRWLKWRLTEVGMPGFRTQTP